MKKQPLSPKQQEVYDFLKSYRKKHGYSAGLVDIVGRFGFSYKSAQFHTNALIRKGHLTKPKRGVLLLT